MATPKRRPGGVEGAAGVTRDIEPGTPTVAGARAEGEKAGPPFFFFFFFFFFFNCTCRGRGVEQPSGPQGTPPSSTRYPDRVVFDLDPGPGAGLAECAEVALVLRERLGPLGKRVVPVSSGSKGLHLYVPMDEPITSHQATEWARLAAEQLEKALPTLVVSKMAKSVRGNRVFIDWHQNHHRKTTIAPYSLRGTSHPYVAAPRTWAELSEPGLRHLDYHEVLDRLDDGLDPLATLVQAPVDLAAAAGGSTPLHGLRTSLRLNDSARPTELKTRHPVVEPARPTSLHRPAMLPVGLAGPVDVALARAEETVPGPHALPGGSVYELKFDGYRGAFVRNAAGGRLWSRNRNNLSNRFPEIVTAGTQQINEGTVLDGEICIWNGSRLDFDLLQRRLAGGDARIARQAQEHPASYMVFDLLALDGEDLRNRPWRERRAALEELAVSWSPPLQLSPTTNDVQVATAWKSGYARAGIEGLVVKGASTLYRRINDGGSK